MSSGPRSRSSRARVICYSATVLKVCAHCGVSFDIPAKRRARVYCSRACGWNAKRTCFPTPCLQCGATFTPPRVGVHCCSRKCAGLSLQRHHVRTCEQCGGTFRPPRSASKYCSVKCSGMANRSPPRNPKRLLRRVVRSEKARVLAAQGAACAACRAPFTRPRDAHLDHCHASGKIRGVLCPRCNTALGLLDDDQAKLKALLDYVVKWLAADDCDNVGAGQIAAH